MRVQPGALFSQIRGIVSWGGTRYKFVDMGAAHKGAERWQAVAWQDIIPGPEFFRCYWLWMQACYTRVDAYWGMLTPEEKASWARLRYGHEYRRMSNFIIYKSVNLRRMLCCMPGLKCAPYEPRSWQHVLVVGDPANPPDCYHVLNVWTYGITRCAFCFNPWKGQIPIPSNIMKCCFWKYEHHMPVLYATIKATCTGGGEIVPYGDVQVLVSNDARFHISPYTCFNIKEVYVDDTPQGPIDEYEFNCVTNDHTIHAEFEFICEDCPGLCWPASSEYHIHVTGSDPNAWCRPNVPPGAGWDCSHMIEGHAVFRHPMMRMCAWGWTGSLGVYHWSLTCEGLVWRVTNVFGPVHPTWPDDPYWTCGSWWAYHVPAQPPDWIVGPPETGWHWDGGCCPPASITVTPP